MDLFTTKWNKYKRLLMITAIIAYVLIPIVSKYIGIPERGILGTF